MKTYRYLSIPIVLLVLLISCSGEKKKLFGSGDSSRWTDQDIPLSELDTVRVNTDSIIIADKMKELFPPSDSLVEGRPVSFYLNRRDVSLAAKNFYLLRFIPSDNNETGSLCDSLLTKNDTTRPFYYFLYLRLNKIADGATAEMLPDAALEYSMKFVDEFYKKLELPLYRGEYMTWVYNVSYMLWNSLAKGQDTADAASVRQYIISQQTKNAKYLTASLRNKISQFADSVATHPNDGR